LLREKDNLVNIFFIKDSNEKKGMREGIWVLMWKSAILLFWWENWLFWKFGWVHKKITQNNYRWKNPTDPTNPLNHIKFIFFWKKNWVDSTVQSDSTLERKLTIQSITIWNIVSNMVWMVSDIANGLFVWWFRPFLGCIRNNLT
jgi:hypothetical protein